MLLLLVCLAPGSSGALVTFCQWKWAPSWRLGWGDALTGVKSVEIPTPPLQKHAGQDCTRLQSLP